jgi:hypothetical protein
MHLLRGEAIELLKAHDEGAPFVRVYAVGISIQQD